MLLGMVEDEKCPDTGTAFHPVGKFSESSHHSKINNSNIIPVRVHVNDVILNVRAGNTNHVMCCSLS
jgi:hypothetical protein